MIDVHLSKVLTLIAASEFDGEYGASRVNIGIPSSIWFEKSIQ
jgi:hypothetical protein